MKSKGMYKMQYHSLVCLLILIVNTSVSASSWYAGTWDSTIYTRSEKPRTVALRLEVRDAKTDIPVPGAVVTLRGSYIEELVGRPAADLTYEPQERTYRLTATTGADGVVVFALSWQKEYPWRAYFGSHPPRDYRDDGGWSVKQTYTRAVDDIEKVERIEIRHPDYNYLEMRYNFDHLIDVGQEERSASQTGEVFREFEQRWVAEIGKQNPRYCVLDLGTEFPDFENTECRRPEFFEQIRNEDWGTVYRQPRNVFSLGEHPQSDCGPYFVYEVSTTIEPVAERVDVRTDSMDIPDEKLPHIEDEQARQPSDENSDKEPEAEKDVEEPSDNLRDQNAEHLKELAKRDPLGIAVSDLTITRAESLGLTPIVARNFAGTQGLIIEYILPDSPAHKAGLRENCIITHFKIAGRENHLFDENNYIQALRLAHEKDAKTIEAIYWQFPDDFDGQIDYLNHYKETTIEFDKIGSGLGLLGEHSSDESIEQHPIHPDRAAGTVMTNSIGMELVWIPAGEFLMGSPDGVGGQAERPQRKVTLTEGYWIGRYPVTQIQYQVIMGSNPSRHKSGNHPVTNVSWTRAMEFCKKLSDVEGGTYTLPTEAQWEYACRAGTTSVYFFGDDADKLSEYAWYSSNSGRRTRPVGTKKPNPWGLYDMYGNVWECCLDWYNSGFYSLNRNIDPVNSELPESNRRVLRGGGWNYDARHCRSAYRRGRLPGSSASHGGFRVVFVSGGLHFRMMFTKSICPESRRLRMPRAWYDESPGPIPEPSVCVTEAE